MTMGYPGGEQTKRRGDFGPVAWLIWKRAYDLAFFHKHGFHAGRPADVPERRAWNRSRRPMRAKRRAP
jgi:hypothetical protein